MAPATDAEAVVSGTGLASSLSHGLSPRLSVQQLSHHYGNRNILDHVSFTVAGGEFVAIRGESGSGKSTLLNLVAGLGEPAEGSIVIDGIELSACSEERRTRLRRSMIGFVFQAFHVLPHLRVGQNVELPLVLLGVPAKEREPRVLQMLDAVGLRDRAASLPRELSGGELQRVAVARALVHRPALVLADEPTGNLDPATAGTILSLLRDQCRTAGAATLLVTHSATAAAAADRALMLAGGKLHPVPAHG